MKDYIIKAYEEELGNTYYKVTVPKDIQYEDIIAAFKIAKKYTTSEFWEYEDDINLGIENYDEHYEKMLEIAEAHRLEVFQFYISKCKGWKIKEISFDFDYVFEW